MLSCLTTAWLVWPALFFLPLPPSIIDAMQAAVSMFPDVPLGDIQYVSSQTDGHHQVSTLFTPPVQLWRHSQLWQNVSIPGLSSQLQQDQNVTSHKYFIPGRWEVAVLSWCRSSAAEHRARSAIYMSSNWMQHFNWSPVSTTTSTDLSLHGDRGGGVLMSLPANR